MKAYEILMVMLTFVYVILLAMQLAVMLAK